MIRKLQQKIVLIVTFLLAVSVVVLMFAVNFIAQTETNKKIDRDLELLAKKGGFNQRREPDPFRQDDGITSDYYVVTVKGYVIADIIGSRDEILNGEQFADYVNDVLATGKNKGYYGKYAYYIEEKKFGPLEDFSEIIIVFLDASSLRNQNHQLLVTTSVIGAGAVIGFFFLSIGLSFWLVKPVRDTFEKQKLFISNASHELKTPLAVISANSDVLENEIGDNKWLGYIKNETGRMSELVNELLYLARMDDKSGQQAVVSEFSLSDVVLSTALPFESRMFEAGKQYDVDVQENVSYRGDKSAIKHLLMILIDNAVKYSDEKGEIRVSLCTRGSKRIIEVYNTGKGVRPENTKRIFERFFREDEARNSKSGGYGLGLSIASEVARKHGGQIRVESEYEKWIKFIVTL